MGFTHYSLLITYYSRIPDRSRRGGCHSETPQSFLNINTWANQVVLHTMMLRCPWQPLCGIAVTRRAKIDALERMKNSLKQGWIDLYEEKERAENKTNRHSRNKSAN
jgi:hypothetical protein